MKTTSRWMPLALTLSLIPAALPADPSGHGSWRAALVFHRAGALQYQGVVYYPQVAASLLAGTPTEADSDRATDTDDEVWLARDGDLMGVWIDPAHHRYGRMLSGGKRGKAVPDDGTFSQIVTTAKPAQAPASEPASAKAIADWPGAAPTTLSALADGSPVIALGRVAGILRVAHTPENAPFEMQHTVFLFAVEQYLKQDAPGLPPVLKVWQEGGALAWTCSDGSSRTGRGYAIMDDPLLHVGDRYCLFLRHQPDPGGQFTSAGFVSGSANGIAGKQAELDEYREVSNIAGKFLLRNGKVCPPEVADPNAGPAANAPSMPNTFGASESDLIAAIHTAANTPAGGKQ